MARAGLSSFSLHLPDALGDPWFELDAGGKSVSGAFRQTPTLDLLDFPGEVAARDIHCVDLCIQHIPNIEPGYLAELRAAFQSAEVELYQLLVDIGELGSADPAVEQRRDRADQTLDRNRGRAGGERRALCPGRQPTYAGDH